MLLGALFIQVAQAQTQPPQAPAATPARPTPPTRAIDGPGAPPFTKIPVGNAPLVGGDFVIGPDCSPAPELTVKDGVPAGHVLQFTMESKDSKFYPGIARDGTPDPKNPRTLVVETHPNEYQRTITVYVPAQYRKGSESPLIVTHDGPKLGVLPAVSAGTRSSGFSGHQGTTRHRANGPVPKVRRCWSP